MEIWKSIRGYEGLYEISNLGNVLTVEGKTTYSIRHGQRVWSSRILKQKTDKGGYKRVTLYKDKTPKTWLVHRIVALHFCDKKQGQDIVNHKDGNPSNNHFTNLEWCDSKGNVNHAFDNGLMTTAHKIMLSSPNGRVYTFRSMSEASQFLGRGKGYISALLKKGVEHTGIYKITVLKAGE